MRLILWALFACAHKAPEMAPIPQQDELHAAPDVRSGTVVGGTFTDRNFGFTIPVLEGWVVEPGPESGRMRVAFDHVPTGTRVEIWVFDGSSLEPRVREGCDWRFQDTGHFSVLESMGTVAVATCVPKDPEGLRVYAYLFARDGSVVQIEVHTPSASLVTGKSAGDDVIRGFRW